MSFFNALFNKKRTRSTTMIDIGADSVAGAYAVYTQNEPPTISYARRLPIDIREGEQNETAMLRSLELLGNTLIREGAPVLMRTTGSGRSDSILVSVSAPWQKTAVRTEHFESGGPFIFSKELVKEALEKTGAAPAGQVLVDESIIGTILNGYETRDPYGKEAHRASVVILTSYIDEKVMNGIRSAFRGLFHTKEILFLSGSSLRYQAMRIAFPHERDALILDATGPLTSLALVRRDLLVSVLDVPMHKIGTAVWLETVSRELAVLAERFPLPRTIFLLTREADNSSLGAMLDTANLGKLWLSDNPPKIVSVQGSHLSNLVRQTTTEPADLSLLLMALFWQYHAQDN